MKLLNGIHTLSCGLAFLGGFDTGIQAMADLDFRTIPCFLSKY